MQLELKKEIVNFMLNNYNEFQLIHTTVNQFRQYIYKDSGDFCVGGREVLDFVCEFYNLLKS